MSDQVKRWKAKGFIAAKVKVGKPDIEEDVERLKAIQEAVPGFPLAVDANQGWDLPAALRAFKKFDDLDLLWIEEPLPSDDILGHRILRERVNTPLAMGENIYNLNQFNQYFEQGSCDYVQADLGRVGGITGYLDIAAAARAHNLPMTPHFVFELSASLLSTIPNIYASEVTDGGTWTDLRINQEMRSDRRWHGHLRHRERNRGRRGFSAAERMAQLMTALSNRSHLAAEDN